MSTFLSRNTHDFTSKEAQQLLHNRFVVILGDSIHRTIYKDLICFLQKDKLLTEYELKAKGNERVCNDHRVEGGAMNNKTSYREVRQYRTDHHLIRAYFLTRVYSSYMESILDDFRAEPPDLIILNSCLWDLNRYLDENSSEPLEKAFREYRQNLQTLFQKLHEILPATCLVIWDTAMPIAREVQHAYLEQGMKNKSTPEDVLRANFEGAVLACCYQFDVLDLNFYFRFLTKHWHQDGVHWSREVHRFVTKLLLTHVANAWGVELKMRRPQCGIALTGNGTYQHHAPQQLQLSPPPPAPLWKSPPEPTGNGAYEHYSPQHLPLLPLPPAPLWKPEFAGGHLSPPAHFNHNLDFQCDFVSASASPLNYFAFEDVYDSTAYREGTQQGGFRRPIRDVPDGRWWGPHHPPPPYHVEDVSDGRQGGPPALPCRAPRGFHGGPWRERTMRSERYRPYTSHRNCPGSHLPFKGPPYQGPRGW